VESWLELIEAPPPPSDFGLNDDSTQLELITEFLISTEPHKSTLNKNGLQDDVTLSWDGRLRMPSGVAFKAGEKTKLHVRKQWTLLENRRCLIEGVDYTSAKAALKQLPTPNHASIGPNAKNRIKHLAGLKRELPARLAMTLRGKSSLQIAKATSPNSSFLLDYSILASGGPTTFSNGITYVITNAVSLTGTTILEGGAVIKYGTNSDAKISIESLDCKTAPYIPAILTSINDDTIGETITGSTGNAWTNYCGYAAFESSTPDNCPMENLRFCHLNAVFAIPSERRSVR